MWRDNALAITSREFSHARSKVVLQFLRLEVPIRRICNNMTHLERISRAFFLERIALMNNDISRLHGPRIKFTTIVNAAIA